MNVTSREEVVPLTPQALQVILALALGPMHGYDLTRQCEQDSQGVIWVGRGTVYRTITRLVQLGLVREDLGNATFRPGKLSRWYRLTEAGREVLDWEIDRAKLMVHLGYERLDKPKKELESSFFTG